MNPYMRQCLAGLVALAMGLSCPPLAAQDQAGANDAPVADESAKPGQAPTGTADTPVQKILPPGMNADQLIQFFHNFSASDLMEQSLAPEIERMMQPGPVIENWQDEGIDILGQLEALEGGAAANLLRDLGDETILVVTDMTGNSQADFDGYHSIALRPEPVGLVAERSFASYAPGIWLEIASQRTARGKAQCYGGYYGITLHAERPYTQWSEDELLLNATIFSLFDRLSAQAFCVIYGTNEAGQYTGKAFTPEGELLGAMNEEMDPSVPMALSDLPEFLQREPVAEAGAE